MIKEVKYTLIAIAVGLIAFILGCFGVGFFNHISNALTFFCLILAFAGIICSIVFILGLWAGFFLFKIPFIRKISEKVDYKIKALILGIICIILAIVFGKASAGTGWGSWSYIMLSSGFSVLGLICLISIPVTMLKNKK